MFNLRWFEMGQVGSQKMEPRTTLVCFIRLCIFFMYFMYFIYLNTTESERPKGYFTCRYFAKHIKYAEFRKHLYKINVTKGG